MKWNIREAVDVFFKAKSTLTLGARTIRSGEPVMIFDTVKTSTFEVASEITYVTGGRGDIRIISFEGNKTLTFTFEDALLSAEGLTLLAGAELIPARNKRLAGSAPEARSIISHKTEKYSVVTPNIVDVDTSNTYPVDPAIGGRPRGGVNNIWLTEKPYVGQNSAIYVMLLDQAGEMSGAPIEVNMKNGVADTALTYMPTFVTTDAFVAFDAKNQPMSLVDYPAPTNAATNGVFDDIVKHYVEITSATANWNPSWGDIADFTRTIAATAYGNGWADPDYAYMLQPSGGIAFPKAFLEGSTIVYKVNVPSALYQDIILIDYYVENRHDATQVSILPDKFGPFLYVEGSSLLRRASDGLDIPVEFVIPKFKIMTQLTLTFAGSGEPAAFTFTGDSYPDFSKFDPTRKVLADIQIIGADDNYDGASGASTGDPTSYRRMKFNEDELGDYFWKDPSIAAHANIDVSDTGDYNAEHGGPVSKTPGEGLIDA